MCWIPSKDNGFLVSDYYRILVGTTFYGFPWKSIWKRKIPSRVAFFVWTAALGKCLAINNLRKRKLWILDWCYTCKRNGEWWISWPSILSLSFCYGSMVYGFGSFWSNLVVIEMVIFGPSFLIAYCGVFRGREIVDVLKILRDLFRTSSFSFLEL